MGNVSKYLVCPAIRGLRVMYQLPSALRVAWPSQLS
jgi:hypothetical protein